MLVAPSSETHPTLRAQAGTVFEWSDLFSDSYPLTSEGQENHEEDEDFLAPPRETTEARAQYTPEPVPPTIKPAPPEPRPAPASTSTGSASGSSKAAPSPSNPPKPKTQKVKPPVPEAFRDLVSILEAARLKGVARLSTSDIGQKLPKHVRKNSYQLAGVTQFVPWLQKAEAQGVVQLISLTKEGTGWVALREAYT
ncbi:hypothetical protein FRB99_006978 [Tulasnella sp. 403]|nr:hypothetical protein FRB99_006978 [Tulasnella sp. 403]